MQKPLYKPDQRYSTVLFEVGVSKVKLFPLDLRLSTTCSSNNTLLKAGQ
jgi:hypothetical protein